MDPPEDGFQELVTHEGHREDQEKELEASWKPDVFHLGGALLARWDNGKACGCFEICSKIKGWKGRKEILQSGWAQGVSAAAGRSVALTIDVNI